MKQLSKLLVALISALVIAPSYAGELSVSGLMQVTYQSDS